MTDIDDVRADNLERGELSLTLDGQEMILRPSHEAIEEFERLLDKGLIQITREALNGSLHVSEAAQVATACIRAWGRENGKNSIAASKAPRIRELILEAEGGYHVALTTLSAMLSLASTGGYTAKGEPKAATSLTTDVPPAAA